MPAPRSLRSLYLAVRYGENLLGITICYKIPQYPLRSGSGTPAVRPV
ncbi:MAG: hypothetical protein ACKVHE_23970 [Planctomycetales bacterium]